jgi:hypothetical protein
MTKPVIHIMFMNVILVNSHGILISELGALPLGILFPNHKNLKGKSHKEPVAPIIKINIYLAVFELGVLSLCYIKRKAIEGWVKPSS